MRNTLLKMGNAISSSVIKISENVRNIIMYICLAVLNISCYVYIIDAYCGYTCPAMLNAGLGTLLFAILIIIGMDREYTEEVFEKSWMLVLFLSICGATIVVSGFLHDIGYSYIAMGLFMTIMMPVYCLVWGDKEHLSRLYIALARVIVVLFVAFFFLHVFVAPRSVSGFYMDGRYMGMGSNPNGIAKVAAPSYYAALYLICVGKKKKRFLFAIVMGLSMAMLIMASSRASFLAECVLTLFCVWTKGKNSIKEKMFKNFVLNAAIVLLIVGVTIPIAKYGLEWNTNKLKKQNPTEAAQMIDDIDIVGRVGQGRNEDGTTDLNSASSERFAIWIDVIRGAEFMGRDKDDIVFNAHNAIIEYLKRSGWIAAISFFLVELGSAIWILVTVFSKKKVDNYQMFAVMGITAYGIVSLFDIVDLPFAKFITTIFYLCFAAMCVKRKSTIS